MAVGSCVTLINKVVKSGFVAHPRSIFFMQAGYWDTCSVDVKSVDECPDKRRWSHLYSWPCLLQSTNHHCEKRKFISSAHMTCMSFLHRVQLSMAPPCPHDHLGTGQWLCESHCQDLLLWQVRGNTCVYFTGRVTKTSTKSLLMRVIMVSTVYLGSSCTRLSLE